MCAFDFPCAELRAVRRGFWQPCARYHSSVWRRPVPPSVIINHDPRSASLQRPLCPSGTAVAPAEAKGQQDETPAKAEQWSDAEIIKALADCVRLLAPIKTTVAVSKPIREGQCGAPAPISSKALAA